MANADRPMGFKPVKYLSGAPWNGKFTIYSVLSDNPAAIFVGDLVKSGGSADANGVASVVTAAAADANLLGVAIGFGMSANQMVDYTNLNRTYCPASTAMYCAVVDDPNVVFEVQEDSDANNIAITMVGENADMVSTHAGNTTTGVSGQELDSSDHKAATAQLRILGHVQRADNEVGDHAKLLVLINEHTFKLTTGT